VACVIDVPVRALKGPNQGYRTSKLSKNETSTACKNKRSIKI